MRYRCYSSKLRLSGLDTIGKVLPSNTVFTYERGLLYQDAEVESKTSLKFQRTGLFSTSWNLRGANKLLVFETSDPLDRKRKRKEQWNGKKKKKKAKIDCNLILQLLF